MAVGFLVGFTATFGAMLIGGASVKDAARAGAVAGAVAAVMAVVLQPVMGPMVDNVAKWFAGNVEKPALGYRLLAAGSFAAPSASLGAATGDWSGVIAFGLSAGIMVAGSVKLSQGATGAGGISQENQLKFNAREFNQRYGVATRPSGGVGGLLRTAGRVGVDVIGKLWALPNTIIGGVVGLGGVPFGARVKLGNNAIQFLDFPLGEAGEGLTLGNVQIFPRGSDPATSFGFYYGSSVPINLGLHEQAHTFQYQVFGPTFLPAYFLSGGVSASNPFELAANRYALGGSFFP